MLLHAVVLSALDCTQHGMLARGLPDQKFQRGPGVRCRPSLPCRFSVRHVSSRAVSLLAFTKKRSRTYIRIQGDRPVTAAVQQHPHRRMRSLLT